MESVIVWMFVSLLLFIGLLGTIVPALPGNPIIFLGVLLHVMFHGMASVGVVFFVIIFLIAIFAQVFDYLAGAYGAKKMGSTAWGVWGSIFFGILGMILGNVVGMVSGIFLGAVIFEIIFARKSMNHSLKVGLGSILGFLGGTALKFILGIVMIVLFFVGVF
ncbi:MAG: DUF456 domain-containing protein [Candidatus Moranbacteria bacterium]|nr:DUF456 domain-containing protein [Candidatus Moranbacteria bacterium]